MYTYLYTYEKNSSNRLFFLSSETPSSGAQSSFSPTLRWGIFYIPALARRRLAGKTRAQTRPATNPPR